MNIQLVGKVLATAITSCILVLVAASPLAAQKPFDNSEYIYCCQENQSHWYGERGHHSRNYYDLKNIETLNGRVVSVDTYPSPRGSSQGIHLLLNTGQETVEVHLGPSWYLEDQNFEITPKDKVTIIGSRINRNGEPEIIAGQIKKGNETVRLRDENGLPLWRRGQK